MRPRKKSKAQSWQVGEASQFLKCGKAHERATNAIGVAAEWPCSSRQPWAICSQDNSGSLKHFARDKFQKRFRRVSRRL